MREYARHGLAKISGFGNFSCPFILRFALAQIANGCVDYVAVSRLRGDAFGQSVHDRRTALKKIAEMRDRQK
jgi:hypothetical protein